MSASLVFVKQSGTVEELKALAVGSGSILTLSEGRINGAYDVTDNNEELKAYLKKMTIDNIKLTMTNLGCRLTATGRGGRSVRMTKDNYVDALMEHWETIKQRASSRASASTSLTTPLATSSLDTENDSVKVDQEKIKEDGLRTIAYEEHEKDSNKDSEKDSNKDSDKDGDKDNEKDSEKDSDKDNEKDSEKDRTRTPRTWRS